MISQADRLAIIDLCARYSFFTDTGAAAEVARLFVADGVFDGPPGRYEGHDQIVEFNEQIHELIKGSMHFTDNHLFDVEEGYIRHRCHLSLQIPDTEGVKISLLTYDDEIVKVADKWKFRIRKCLPLGS